MSSVTTVLADKARQQVKMPSNDEERRRTAQEFHTIRNFPRVIGAIDCKILHHSPDTITKNLNNGFIVAEVFVRINI